MMLVFFYTLYSAHRDAVEYSKYLADERELSKESRAQLKVAEGRLQGVIMMCASAAERLGVDRTMWSEMVTLVPKIKSIYLYLLEIERMEGTGGDNSILERLYIECGNDAQLLPRVTRLRTPQDGGPERGAYLYSEDIDRVVIFHKAAFKNSLGLLYNQATDKEEELKNRVINIQAVFQRLGD